MGSWRLVCAGDRQERKHRHRDHLEVARPLGSSRRPAHVPPLMVHVARCEGSLSWPDPWCSHVTTYSNKPPATTATITP
jgi:hypothetical protein